MTILCVDDDRRVADVTAAALEAENESFDVETVDSADKALERIRDEPPDCLLSDYAMAGMNGIELCEAVRETHTELPILLLTGAGSEAIASRAISAGITDYVTKAAGAEQYTLLANRITNAVEAYWTTQAANQQNALLRLTEHIGDTGGWELDVDTGELLVTDSTRRVLGLPTTEPLSTETLVERFHPDDQNEISEALDRAAENAESTHTTWRLPTPDGRNRYIEMTIFRIISPGETAILRGAVHDVTEYERRRQELTTERQFIDQALDALTDLFYVIDVDGTVRRWNQQVSEVTGYSDAELDGMQAIELFPENQREAVVEAITEAVSTGQSTVEADVLTADGERIPCEFNGARLTDSDGEITQLVGIGRDITERKARSEELRRKSRALDEAPVGITITDPSQDDNPMIYVNDRFTQLSGYPLDELLGRNCRFLQGPNTLREPVATLRDGIDNAEPVSVELRNYRKDHSEFWNQLEIAPVRDETGTVVNYVGFQQDVTDRIERERALEKRERILRELHTATREFYPPGSTADISAFLVEFVERAFGFGYVSLKQFDEQRGSLVPSTVSSATAEDTPAMGPVSPGENPIWQAYATGTASIVNGDRLSISEQASIEVARALVVPIGDFGVTVAFSADADGFDQVDLELIEVVAANAEAAFQRLRSDQARTEATAELSTVQSKLDDVNGVIDVLRTVQTRLATSDSQGALETVVCEELARTARIDFVWIGRPQGRETDLKPTEWGGNGGRYLDGIETETQQDRMPAQRAALTHQQASVSDIPARVLDEPWAKDALSAGFRSTLCVPLVYDGVLYGVISAYSHETEAFDRLYEDLLTNVASLVVNYERILEHRYSDQQASYIEREFRLGGSTYPLQRLAVATDTRIQFETVTENTDETIGILVTVVEGSTDAVADYAPKISSIVAADLVGSGDNQQLSLTVKKPFLPSVVAKHGGRLVHSMSEASGTTVRIAVPANTSHRPLVDSLLSRYDDISLLSQEQTGGPQMVDSGVVTDILTDRQYEILSAAYHGGYYETPRRVTGEDLAASFDISSPTVYNHLQAAHRTLFTRIFEP